MAKSPRGKLPFCISPLTAAIIMTMQRDRGNIHGGADRVLEQESFTTALVRCFITLSYFSRTGLLCVHCFNGQYGGYNIGQQAGGSVMHIPVLFSAAAYTAGYLLIRKDTAKGQEKEHGNSPVDEHQGSLPQ